MTQTDASREDLLRTIGTFFGVSADIELSRMILQDRIRIEAGVGLTKHCSMGVLLNTKARECADWGGLTLHVSVPLRGSSPR